MRVAVTGTPGTGKTTATDLVDTDLVDTDLIDTDLVDTDPTDTDLVESELTVVHLNEIVRSEGLYTHRDEERDSLVADLDAIREWVGDSDDVMVESHLAHYLDADRVIVLRCRPEELERRLRDRGESVAKARENTGSPEPPRALTRKARENTGSPEPPRALTRKARENAESEALDVILAEAVERHGEDAVYEIDTTGREPESVASDIEAVIAGTREPSAGTVSFVDYL